MIVVCGGLKGGTGKTALATNLAVIRSNHGDDGKDVLLIDADEQGSSALFSERRNHAFQDAGYTLITQAGAAVQTETLKLKPKYDDIIIDVGGRHTTSLRAAMAVADVFLIPCPPRSVDTDTLPQLSEIITEMKVANEAMKVYCFINRADINKRDNDDAKTIISEIPELKFINTPLGSRKAFGNAHALGQSVIELKGIYKDSKASEEMIDLYKYIWAI